MVSSRVPLVLAGVVCALWCTPLVGAQSFAPADTVRFLLGRSEAVEVPLYAQSATVLAPRGRIKSLLDPEGRRLDDGAIGITMPDSIPETGQSMTLRPDPASFRTPGTYKAVVEIRAANVNPVTLQVAFVRQAGKLAMSELEGRTVRLWKMPGSDAPETTLRTVLDNLGEAPLDGVTVLGRAVVASDGKTLASGRVRAMVLGSGGGVPAGPNALSLTLDGFDAVGTYTAGVTVRSPGLTAPAVIPFTVEVSHRPVWAVGVILLGVLFGFAVQRLVTGVKGGADRLALLRLRDDLDRLRVPAERSNNMRLWEMAFDEVRRSLTALDDGAPHHAAEAAQAVDNLREAIATARQAAYDALIALDAAVAGGADRAPEEAREVAQRTVSEARRLLSQGEVAKATARIKDASNAWQAAMAAEDALEHGVELMTSDRARIRRPSIPSIEVQDAVANRRANRTLHIKALHIPAEAARYQWDFGDGTPGLTTDSPTAEHAFADPGKYYLSVTLQRDDGTPLRLVKGFVEVLQSRAQEQIKAVRARRQRFTLILTAVSIVVATVVGVRALYNGSVFGTPFDYIGAFLWGFGIDAGVTSLADVLGLFRTSSAPTVEGE